MLNSTSFPQELRRHIYANSVDEQTIRKLLNFVFADDDEGEDSFVESGKRPPYREVAVPLEGAVETLDLPEENISTLLCYLENDRRRRWVRLLNPVYSACKVRCYGGPRQLRAVARRSPPLAAAIALAKKDGKAAAANLERSAQFEFPVVEVWDSTMECNLCLV